MKNEILRNFLVLFVRLTSDIYDTITLRNFTKGLVLYKIVRWVITIQLDTLFKMIDGNFIDVSTFYPYNFFTIWSKQNELNT